MPTHPMDQIPVRPLRFEYESVENDEPLWSRSKPDFAMFMNALGVDVPHFERFLVAVMRRYRTELTPAEPAQALLLKDVQAIIGQEAHHAFNFLRWNQHLAGRYPKLPALDTQAKQYFDGALAARSRKFHIGFTAGYETFTFLGGMIILNRYEERMADADPTIRALWVWHQVEEVEHGAVAFDFYRHFYPDSEWYRRWMVVFAFCHISFETFKAYAHMVKCEGYLRSPRKALRAWKFFTGFAWDLARSALPVLSRHYHPRNHPICNAQQNRIAIAWRDLYGSDRNAHPLTNQDMDALLKHA